MTTAPTVDVAAQIRTLDGMAELAEAIEVLRSIWGFPDAEAPISAELLRALTLAGGYVAGAFADGQMIAASAGFLGHRAGVSHLHSHISGVRPDWQGRHVGLALKHHQREWALARGLTAIEWTFDPLVRRNAYFNLVKLGARVAGFEADFYGEMHDTINAGDPTDRAVVHWNLEGAVSTKAAAGGAVILHPDDQQSPVVARASAPVLRAWVPDDIVALRRRDPAAGRAWRLALRESFGAAIAEGYVAHSMSRDGWYTLVRESGL
jgi:predicted GNAT superfamily acetyltransferase